jgi:hypothetical protein
VHDEGILGKTHPPFNSLIVTISSPSLISALKSGRDRGLGHFKADTPGGREIYSGRGMDFAPN